jgi:hypothetical protein
MQEEQRVGRKCRFPSLPPTELRGERAVSQPPAPGVFIAFFSASGRRILILELSRVESKLLVLALRLGQSARAHLAASVRAQVSADSAGCLAGFRTPAISKRRRKPRRRPHRCSHQREAGQVHIAPIRSPAVAVLSRGLPNRHRSNLALKRPAATSPQRPIADSPNPAGKQTVQSGPDRRPGHDK